MFNRKIIKKDTIDYKVNIISKKLKIDINFEGTIDEFYNVINDIFDKIDKDCYDYEVGKLNES